MNTDMLLEAIVDAIGDAKGLNIQVMNVQELTDITDYMVIVTGSSNRHVKSIARTIIQKLTDLWRRVASVEGEEHAQWILLDYTDVVVHVMLAETREFYDLERLWDKTLTCSAVAISNNGNS